MIRALLACLLLAGAAQAQDAPRVAGSFQLVEGSVRLEDKAGRPRAAAVGGEVYEGDTLSTEAGAEAHLQMADGASLILRENSRITVAAYVADGGEGDRSLIELARGALRSITGWIGRYNRSNYAIRTPLVTIGVRGTDHEPAHLLEGDPRGEPGSYDKVNEGTTFMKSDEGTVEVAASRAAFRAHGRAVRARLLERRPAFYRPGRFERRFESRAREARKTIRERREARRELLKQRRAPAGTRFKERRERRQDLRERRERPRPETWR